MYDTETAQASRTSEDLVCITIPSNDLAKADQILTCRSLSPTSWRDWRFCADGANFEAAMIISQTSPRTIVQEDHLLRHCQGGLHFDQPFDSQRLASDYYCFADVYLVYSLYRPRTRKRGGVDVYSRNVTCMSANPRALPPIRTVLFPFHL